MYLGKDVLDRIQKQYNFSRKILRAVHVDTRTYPVSIKVNNQHAFALSQSGDNWSFLNEKDKNKFLALAEKYANKSIEKDNAKKEISPSTFYKLVKEISNCDYKYLKRKVALQYLMHRFSHLNTKMEERYNIKNFSFKEYVEVVKLANESPELLERPPKDPTTLHLFTTTKGKTVQFVITKIKNDFLIPVTVI